MTNEINYSFLYLRCFDEHKRMITNNICIKLLLSYVGENGARSVTGHIMSAGFPLELSTAGILLLRNICSFVLAVARYHQNNNMTATRLV